MRKLLYLFIGLCILALILAPSEAEARRAAGAFAAALTALYRFLEAFAYLDWVIHTWLWHSLDGPARALLGLFWLTVYGLALLGLELIGLWKNLTRRP